MYKYEISKSHARCRKYLPDPMLKKVKKPEFTDVNGYPTDKMVFARDFVIFDLVEIIRASLEQHEAVLFHMNPEKEIFSFWGNTKTVRHFEQLGIGVGSCADEKYIGTTSAVLTGNDIKKAWMSGENHYLNVLKPYSSISLIFDREYIGETHNLIFVPNEHYSELFKSFVHMYYIARLKTMQSYQKTVRMIMTSNLYHQIKGSKALVMLDCYGSVLSINQKFSELFDVGNDRLESIRCEKLFDEFHEALKCFDTGEKIVKEKVRLKGLPPDMFFRMEVSPISQDKNINGIIVAFSPHTQAIPNRNKAAAINTFDSIIGKSKIITSIKEKAMKASASTSAVIITGSSGTGKELFAHAIHNGSKRRNAPFVALNCAAMPGELIMSELFGYAEGAFTGAKKGGSVGKLEYAHGGTIFLDEIAEMPVNVQAVLLRFLEDHTITRIGSNTPVKVDVRVICATNKDLKHMVQEETFRMDLYYRLNVINLHLPPLRDRQDDILVLLKYYLKSYNILLGRHITGFSQQALNCLENYDWPGNLRELKNTVEYCVNYASGQLIDLNHLPKEIIEAQPVRKESTKKTSSSYSLMERNKILELLMEHNGNKSAVASEMNISRGTLYRKMKTHNI